MQHRTIRELARVVSSRSLCPSSLSSITVEGLRRLDEFDAKWRPSVAGRIENVQRVLPCTPRTSSPIVSYTSLTAVPLVQEGMLSETLQNPKAYWAHHLMPLEPHVDITRLLQAWRVVAASTEALRAGFVPTAQVIDTIDNAKLPYVTCRLERANANSIVTDLSSNFFTTNRRFSIPRPTLMIPRNLLYMLSSPMLSKHMPNRALLFGLSRC